eukprot:12085042-Heterocapsa_arctica.AAC.1
MSLPCKAPLPLAPPESLGSSSSDTASASVYAQNRAFHPGLRNRGLGGGTSFLVPGNGLFLA